MAKRFLSKHGTVFKNPANFSNMEILSRYAKIMMSLRGHKQKVGQKRIPFYGLYGQRSPRTQDSEGSKIEGFRFPGASHRHAWQARFFANKHHEKIFNTMYLVLCGEINRACRGDYVMAFLGKEVDTVWSAYDALKVDNSPEAVLIREHFDQFVEGDLGAYLPHQGVLRLKD